MQRMTLPADPTAITEGALRLRAGELVAFPTETVYGLGGDATNGRAVAAIFAAKGRPRFNPLIVHVTGLAEAELVAVFDARARQITERFWPGPLSLVLPRRPDSAVSLLACAGLNTVAIRAPSHPVARELLAAFGRPIAAPSANRSGRVSPTEAAHVQDEIGERVGLILDGGRCPVGLESTVLDLSGERPRLLRPGAVTREELIPLLGEIGSASGGAPRAPGMLASHYAPSLPLRLNAIDARPGEALLAFGAAIPVGFVQVECLSRAGDLVEAAANLFALLRRLDDPSFTGIAVMPIPETGLGLAINDRLRRAAAPRETG
jgi:L-threonylcarbamoyladenylate synthase